MSIISVANSFFVWLVICSTLSLNAVKSQNEKEFGQVKVQVEPDDDVIARNGNSMAGYDIPIHGNAHSEESVQFKRPAPDAQNAGLRERQASLPVQQPVPSGQYDQLYRNDKPPMANFMEKNRENMKEAFEKTWKLMNQKGAPIPDHLMNSYMYNLANFNPANKDAVKNWQDNINWNPSRSNFQNEHVLGGNGPQYTKQNLEPPLQVPSNYPEAMLEAYKQLEKYMMSHENQMQNTMHRKNRPSVPPEFLLEEIFFYPSLSLASIGQNVQPRLNSEDSTFTVLVQSGIKDCYFYTPLTHFRIDYQVIHGGALDMGLFVKAPDGEPIAIRPPVPNTSIVINVPPYFRFLPYAICLDNRKASRAEKQTYLSIDLEMNWDNPDSYERYIIELIQRKYNTTDPEIANKAAEFDDNLNNVTVLIDMNNSIQSPDRWDDNEAKEWKTAAEAGEKFSSLYYRAFDSRRSDLPGFFMDNAQLLWNGNRAEGRQSVIDFLNKLPKSNITLHSLSAQPIHKNLTGENPLYLVNVVGTVKFEHHQPRIFSDTFFLTQDDSLWRVQSATFRFLD